MKQCKGDISFLFHPSWIDIILNNSVAESLYLIRLSINAKYEQKSREVLVLCAFQQTL